MANIGLYYPFIHFKDDNRLKLSALYWDKLARIVPPGYGGATRSNVVLKTDSRITRELADELDFIVNVSPRGGTPILTLFEQLLSRYANRLRAKYDVQKQKQWPVDPVTRDFARLRDKRLAYVKV